MADVNRAGLTAEELEFRDDAALAALAGMLADAVGIQKMADEATAEGMDVTQYVAEASYEIADAMLAARASGSKGAEQRLRWRLARALQGQPSLVPSNEIGTMCSPLLCT